jgi:hypothetical protein
MMGNRSSGSMAESLLVGMAMGAAATMAVLYAGDWHFHRKINHLADEAACAAKSAARRMGM